MIESVLRRAAQSVVVLLLMSCLAFAGINIVGDPIQLLVPPNATPQELAQASRELGLDQPLHTQYLVFLRNALHGELGTSFVANRPALEMIVERAPATFELALTALAISALLGIPLGMLCGLGGDGLLRRIVMGGSILGVTIPTFWMSLLLILVFAVNLGWLPSGGRGEVGSVLGVPTSLATIDGIRHIVLPAVTLALFKTALVIRLTEAGTREVMGQEFIRFARAKGVGGARLLVRHVAPNVLIPVVTALGLEFGQLIAFSVVTESIFAWPGMGKLIIDSILQLDRPVVVAYLMVTLLIFVVINFAVDALYLVLDPRLRTKGH
jgi:peptide/nickel transport system permease protein